MLTITNIEKFPSQQLKEFLRDTPLIHTSLSLENNLLDESALVMPKPLATPSETAAKPLPPRYNLAIFLFMNNRNDNKTTPAPSMVS
jgi:hypothetical protein